MAKIMNVKLDQGESVVVFDFLSEAGSIQHERVQVPGNRDLEACVSQIIETCQILQPEFPLSDGRKEEVSHLVRNAIKKHMEAANRQMLEGVPIEVSFSTVSGDARLKEINMSVFRPVRVDEMRAEIQHVLQQRSPLNVQLVHGDQILKDTDTFGWFFQEPTLNITVVIVDKPLVDPRMRQMHVDAINSTVTGVGGHASLNHIQSRLREDKVALADPEIMALAATKYAPCVGNPISRADHDVMLAVVKVERGTLKFGSPAIQEDKEIVLAAVKNDPSNLRHAANVLRKDMEVVLAAMDKDSSCIRFADESLTTRDEFLDAVRPK